MGNLLLERTGIQPEMFWYGAVDIDPKHCVIWACVKTDSEKQLIKADTTFLELCKDILFDMGYPQETRPYVLVGCESQETVDRESKGN